MGPHVACGSNRWAHAPASRENEMNNVHGPSHILEVGFGFWTSKALLSTVELEVFTRLGDKR